MEQVANQARRRLLKGRLKTQVEEKHLRLPWVISEAVFKAGCTQCNQCIDNCETKVLKKISTATPISILIKQNAPFVVLVNKRASSRSLLSLLSAPSNKLGQQVSALLINA